MQVKEFQKKIVEFAKKWVKKQKYNPTEENTFIHLVEEVGELARQYVNKEKRKEKYSKEELENAIGDILTHVFWLAHLRNLDIEELVLKIIKEEEERILKG